MKNEQRCPHCNSTRIPTESLNFDGETYVFCGECKKVITYDELFSMGVEEQKIDMRIDYYYDEKKEHAIIKMADWKRLLKMLKDSGAEVHGP